LKVANHACDFEKNRHLVGSEKKTQSGLFRQTHNMHAVHTFAARLYEARFWLFLAINLIGFQFLSRLSPN
jgi:hypothetical protein